MKTLISGINGNDVRLPKDPEGDTPGFKIASISISGLLLEFKNAPVFKIPNDGVLINTKKFTVRRFCLPYRKMVVEFQEGANKGDLCNILLLRQATPEGLITLNYFTRTIGSPWVFAPILAAFSLAEGETEIVVEANPNVPTENGNVVGFYRPDNLVTRKFGTYNFEGSDTHVGRMNWVFTTVLQMMMLLACKNVAVKDSMPKPKKGCKLRERMGTHYKELVIEVKNKISSVSAEAPDSTDVIERYRPGEHIRMGHDHRFKTKEGYVTYWIQDIVVNAGVGYKVEKTYKLQPSHC